MFFCKQKLQIVIFLLSIVYIGVFLLQSIYVIYLMFITLI